MEIGIAVFVLDVIDLLDHRCKVVERELFFQDRHRLFRQGIQIFDDTDLPALFIAFADGDVFFRIRKREEPHHLHAPVSLSFGGQIDESAFGTLKMIILCDQIEFRHFLCFFFVIIDLVFHFIPLMVCCFRLFHLQPGKLMIDTIFDTVEFFVRSFLHDAAFLDHDQPVRIPQR